MTVNGLEIDVVDTDARARTVARFKDAGIRLPRIAELADPLAVAETAAMDLAGVDPDAADARNLYRVHWHNGADRRALRFAARAMGPR